MREIIRLRTLPVIGNGKVDRERQIIRGVSLAQTVEALGHNLIIDQKTLAGIVEKGNEHTKGVKSRFTHPGLSGDGLGKYLGRVRNLQVEGDRCMGDLHLSRLAFTSPKGDLGTYILDAAEYEPESFGMSVVMDIQRVWVRENGDEVPSEKGRPEDATTEKPVIRVINLVACDAVDEPAANRDGLFSAHLERSNKLAAHLFHQIDETIHGMGVPYERAFQFALAYFKTRGIALERDRNQIENEGGSKTMNENEIAEIENIEPVEGGSGGGETERGEALSQYTVQVMLATSELPELVQNRLAGGTYETSAQLEGTIRQAQRELAVVREGQVVNLPGPTPRQISLKEGLERLEEAYEGLLLGKSPTGDVRPLTGIREAYLLLSGDYEMQGVFHPDRVQFANVNSSTMAKLTENVLNKAIANEWALYDRWWEPFVHEEDFANLQQISWITLGGVGEIPTVAEGASYSELTWDDKAETQAFVKKGGYLGLTLEAMDKDDTRRIRAMPRVLTQAAWLTLGKSVSAIFTANSGVGPTLSDSKALFHADHGNLGTTALAHSAWSATRTAMRKQTEVNSAERLGGLAVPKFLLVPPDLETTGLEVLASDGEPGTANNDVNVFASGNSRETRLNAARRRVIVVDLWTDTNNWAAVADPRMYPAIGIGYRFGRTPQVFSVASPTAGLMFTNDSLPVKVRFFYAAGVIDYRGLYKHNVA